MSNGDTGPGGSVHLEAGNTTDVLEMGGTLAMTAGAGNKSSWAVKKSIWAVKKVDLDS